MSVTAPREGLSFLRGIPNPVEKRCSMNDRSGRSQDAMPARPQRLQKSKKAVANAAPAGAAFVRYSSGRLE
jgi:hypothetical protein